MQIPKIRKVYVSVKADTTKTSLVDILRVGVNVVPENWPKHHDECSK